MLHMVSSPQAAVRRLVRRHGRHEVEASALHHLGTRDVIVSSCGEVWRTTDRIGGRWLTETELRELARTIRRTAT